MTTGTDSAELRAERVAELTARRDNFNALASVYLTLPTIETVQSLAVLSDVDAEEGTSLAELAAFVREAAEREGEDVLADIARDRVLLVRGAGVGSTTPPYESLWLGRQQNDILGSLNRFFRECGFAKLDEVRDAADQIGVECAFAALLLDRALECLEGDDDAGADKAEATLASFMGQHLARWGADYAQAVVENARTGYWRAVGLLLAEELEGYRAFADVRRA